jgi:predicted transcriptional regulator
MEVNFKQIIKSLSEAGYTHQKLAYLCECSMPTIGAISSGKNSNPQYSVGAKLIELSNECMTTETMKGRKGLR